MSLNTLEFEDEIEESIEFVASAVREQYLEKFEQDLTTATEHIKQLKRQLDAITNDNSKEKQIESLNAECVKLEADVKAIMDKDRRVLKRIDITKRHLNTENRKNRWFAKQVKDEEEKLAKQIASLRDARTIRLPKTDEDNLSSVALAKPWRVITTEEEKAERAATRRKEKQRRDSVQAKIVRVAQRDAMRTFLVQCRGLCATREWRKAAATHTNGQFRSKQEILYDCMELSRLLDLAHNSTECPDESATPSNHSRADSILRIEELVCELAMLPEIYAIIDKLL